VDLTRVHLGDLLLRAADEFCSGSHASERIATRWEPAGTPERPGAPLEAPRCNPDPASSSQTFSQKPWRAAKPKAFCKECRPESLLPIWGLHPIFKHREGFGVRTEFFGTAKDSASLPTMRPR